MGIIAWNIPNWITIVLMVVVGYAILALGAQIIFMITGQSAANDNAIRAPGAFRWMSNFARAA